MNEEPATKGSITRLVVDVQGSDRQKTAVAATKLYSRLFPIAVKRAQKILKWDSAERIAGEETNLLIARTAIGELVFSNRARLFAMLNKTITGRCIDRKNKADKNKPFTSFLTSDNQDEMGRDLFDIPHAPDPDPLIEAEEEALVKRAESLFWESLNDIQKNIIDLHIFQDLSVKDTSSKVGKSKEMVYRHLREVEDLASLVWDFLNLDMNWLRDKKIAACRNEQHSRILHELQKQLDGIQQSLFNLWLENCHPAEIASRLKLRVPKVYLQIIKIDQMVIQFGDV